MVSRETGIIKIKVINTQPIKFPAGNTVKNVRIDHEGLQYIGGRVVPRVKPQVRCYSTGCVTLPHEQYLGPTLPTGWAKYSHRSRPS
jgi:hypothetical protein